MYRIAFRIVRQRSDAEEVRQTVLLRMIQRPEVLPDANRIASWIRRCVVNESITLLRKRKRLTNVEDFAAFEDSLPSSCSDDARQLGSLLERLEPETRALLALRFDEDLTVRQIANIVDKPRSTVHAKIQAAINSLRIQFNSRQGEQS